LYQEEEVAENVQHRGKRLPADLEERRKGTEDEDRRTDQRFFLASFFV
jgi:hypothetical protein